MIVWIDGSGRPAAAPQQHSDVAGQVILATALTLVALTLVALILVLVAAGALARVMLDRRRPAAWDGEWAAADLAVRARPQDGHGARRGPGPPEPGQGGISAAGRPSARIAGNRS